MFLKRLDSIPGKRKKRQTWKIQCIRYHFEWKMLLVSFCYSHFLQFIIDIFIASNFQGSIQMSEAHIFQCSNLLWHTILTIKVHHEVIDSMSYWCFVVQSKFQCSIHCSMSSFVSISIDLYCIDIWPFWDITLVLHHKMLQIHTFDARYLMPNFLFIVLNYLVISKLWYIYFRKRPCEK